MPYLKHIVASQLNQELAKIRQEAPPAPRAYLASNPKTMLPPESAVVHVSPIDGMPVYDPKGGFGGAGAGPGYLDTLPPTQGKPASSVIPQLLPNAPVAPLGEAYVRDPATIHENAAKSVKKKIGKDGYYGYLGVMKGHTPQQAAAIISDQLQLQRKNAGDPFAFALFNQT